MWNEKMEYPENPDAYTIEVEATNYCNAKCVFCAHETSKRSKGYIDTVLFERWMGRMRELQESSWINQKFQVNLFPKVVFGGLGEPLLHPEIDKLIYSCKSNKFRVQVITNGFTLTKDRQEMLINSKVDEVAISFHSLNKEIYEAITGLPFIEVKKNISTFLERCNCLLESERPQVQMWRIKPPIGYKREVALDEEKYKSFMERYPWVSILGPSEPWSRDGVVQQTLCGEVNDDPMGRIWCHKIWFTINLAWDGQVVLCCNDYNRISTPLGNAFSEKWSIEKYIQKKKEIVLNKEKKPDICKKCRRWKDVEFFQIVKDLTKEKGGEQI